MENENLDYIIQQITGADAHVKSLKDRIDQTPSGKKGEWSGKRGTSKYTPIDGKRKKLLEKYGQTSISYNRMGEPDFRPVEEIHVQISNMTNSRAANFRSADERLLKTDYAKERNLKTIEDIKKYRKKHKLTWHEESNGITMCLIDSRINSGFGHSGAVAELGAMKTPINFEDGILRNTGRVVAETKIKAGQKSVEILQTVTDDINVSECKVLEASVDAVRNAEIEIVFISIQNMMAVINDEKTVSEATVDTAGNVAGIAATGVLDELFFSGKGVVPEVVTVACVMKDSFMKYLNDKINEEEFVQEIAQKGVPLLAGKLVGIATGGNIVAQMLATYACALIYNEIQTLIRDYKSIDTMQQEYVARLNRVSKQMIKELQIQQENLKEVFGEDNLKWNQAIDRGFKLITYGNQNMDMQSISRGIDSILLLFGGEVTFKDKNDVRDFLNLQDRVLKL